MRIVCQNRLLARQYPNLEAITYNNPVLPTVRDIALLSYGIPNWSQLHESPMHWSISFTWYFCHKVSAAPQAPGVRDLTGPNYAGRRFVFWRSQLFSLGAHNNDGHWLLATKVKFSTWSFIANIALQRVGIWNLAQIPPKKFSFQIFPKAKFQIPPLHSVMFVVNTTTPKSFQNFD